MTGTERRLLASNLSMRYLKSPRSSHFWALVASSFVLLAACGGATPATDGSTQPPAEAGPATVRIVQDGGCQMMGPNCPTYELDRDGTVRLYRTGEPEVVVEAAVDSAVTDELWQQLNTVDIGALVERAEPGTCQACVDGIDTVISYSMGDEEVSLDSAVIAFGAGEPFFAVFNEAIEAMAAAAPMPTEQR